MSHVMIWADNKIALLVQHTGQRPAETGRMRQQDPSHN